MENKREFTGIWIPVEIWLHPDLDIREKATLGEINSLSNQERGCIANNKHFAKILKLSPNRVSSILNSLQNKGWINMAYKREGKQIKSRSIYLTFNYSPSGYPEPTVEEGDDPIPNMEGGIPNTEEGYSASDKGGIPNMEPPLPDTEPPLPSMRKRKYQEKVPKESTKIESDKTKDDKRNKNENINYKSKSVQFYEQNGFGTISSVVVDSISHWSSDFNDLGASNEQADEVIVKAMEVAAFANNRYWSYVNGILKNWQSRGLFTVEMVNASENEFQARMNKTAKPKTSHARRESLPEWAKKEDNQQTEEEKTSVTDDFQWSLKLYKIRRNNSDSQQKIVDNFNKKHGNGLFEELMEKQN